MPCLDYRSLLNLCATSQYFHVFQRIELVRAYEIALREGAKYGESSYEQDVVDCVHLVRIGIGRWAHRPALGFKFLCDKLIKECHTMILPMLWDENEKSCVRCMWKHRDGENMILDVYEGLTESESDDSDEDANEDSNSEEASEDGDADASDDGDANASEHDGEIESEDIEDAQSNDD